MELKQLFYKQYKEQPDTELFFFNDGSLYFYYIDMDNTEEEFKIGIKDTKKLYEAMKKHFGNLKD